MIPPSTIRRSSSARSTTRRRQGGSSRSTAGCSSSTESTGDASCPPRPRSGSSSIRPIKWLLEKGAIVICAGGGGIPTMYARDGSRTLLGAEVVVDKDRASALLAREVGADLFVMATDVDAVYLDWGTPAAAAASPDDRRGAAQPRLSFWLDGPEGRGSLRVRRRDRAPGGDRRARRHRRDRRRRGGHAGRTGLKPAGTFRAVPATIW